LRLKHIALQNRIKEEHAWKSTRVLGYGVISVYDEKPYLNVFEMYYKRDFVGLAESPFCAIVSLKTVLGIVPDLPSLKPFGQIYTKCNEKNLHTFIFRIL
jgi:hypothetical protein